MEEPLPETLVPLDLEYPVWERVYTVAPLVVVGTREGDAYNLAPKHMALPMGWDNFFGFVCTPRHRTYHNARHEGAFTVSYLQPDQVVMASLASTARADAVGEKPALELLPTFPADVVDGVLVEGGYLFLECEVHRVIDGFGRNSLIVGRIVAARAHERALRTSEVDDQQVLHRSPLLVYLYPGRYARVEQTYAFPFPARFEK